AIQAHFWFQGLEQVVQPSNGLRAAQQKQSVSIQAVVEQRQYPALKGQVEIDQQIAAGNEVQLGERWVQNHIVPGEQYLVPDEGADLVMVVVPDEKSCQPFF